MNRYQVYIGITAGILTGISLLPQLIKIIRTKKAEDISWMTLIVLLAGQGLWIWYGAIKNDYPIIGTNAFSVVVNILIMQFSMKYKNNK